MILFALALLASSPADAAAAPTAAAPTTAPATTAHAPDDLDKVVCHSDPETGTRLSTKKECHTKRDWAQMQADNINNLRQGTH